MLKTITISNYKTFTERTTIDFCATNYKFLESENVTSDKNLKGAIFVGENASGKTNILKAIRLLMDVLFSVTEIDFSQMKSFYTSDPNFEISYQFGIDGSEIQYSIVCNNAGIIEEKLSVDGSLYLHRTKDKAIVKDGAIMHVSNIPDNLSFLRKFYFDTQFNDNAVLNKWFAFLKDSTYINCYDGKILTSTDNIKNLIADNFLERNGVAQFNEFFNKINYNQRIGYTNETHNKKGPYNIHKSEKFVVFQKDGTGVEIPMMYESTGNKTLINLLPVFIHAISHPSMLIIDEFSSGFHNELEECLLKYFFHHAKMSQAFIATHSTNILNTAIVRPDQVYSVCFKGLSGTILKRFSDESPREAQNLEKMYLNGVFDGKPYYKKNF